MRRVPMKIRPAMVPEPGPKVVHTHAAQGFVISNRASGAALALDPRARRIWELCDGKNSAHQIVARLRRQFPLDNQNIRADTFEILELLAQLGFVSLKTAPADTLWERGDSEYFIAQYIAENQSRDQLFVYHLGHRGFFAEVTTLVRCMIYAWKHGMQFVLDSRDFSYSFKDGWTDYFESFCPEYSSIAPGAHDMHCYSSRRGPGTVFDRVLKHAPDQLDLGGFLLSPFVNIMRMFTPAVVRPNPSLRKWIDGVSQRLDLPPVYDAIHVRRGDKIDSEDASYPAAVYLEKLKARGSLTAPIFLLSDSSSTAGEVGKYLRQAGCAAPLVYIEPGTEDDLDIHRYRRDSGYAEHRFVAAPDERARRFVFDHTNRLLAETHFASRSRYFVGTRNSNVSVTVTLLHPQPDNCVLLTRSDLPKCGSSRLRRVDAGEDIERLNAIVIGGCARSGTTLLSTLLSAHTRIFLMSNGKWDLETCTLCRDLTRDDSSLETIKSHLSRIPKRITSWCEKTPANIRYAATTLAYFKGRARFLNIVRDGRDVVTSRHPSNPLALWVAPERWVGDVEAGVRVEDHPHVLTVRYEDLVQETERTLRTICAFIDEPFEPAMLDYPKTARVNRSGAWFGGAAAPMYNDGIGRWRASRYSQAVSELLALPGARELLQRYRYHV